MKALLLTIDSLRKDHLGCYGYHRNTTPFLDSLAEENLKFENAYSPSSHTREAIPSILTGRNPEDSTIKKMSGIKLKGKTIPNKIPEKVKSYAVTSGVYLTSFENLDNGFDRFKSGYYRNKGFTAKYLKYINKVIRNKQFRTGEKVNQEVIRALKEYQDSFVWAHYMDAHHPYNKFDKWHWGNKVSNRKIQYLFRKANHAPSLISEREKKILIDAYDNSIRALDQKLKHLFEKIPDKTKVFITSDHGEAFGENNEYEHPRNLRDHLLEVPLIIKNGHEGTEKDIVSTRDIASSIVELFSNRDETEKTSINSKNNGKVTASCFKAGNRVQRTIYQK